MVQDKSQEHPQQVRIGTAGWSIPRTSVLNFPPIGSHLQRYSNVFSCCEINSSFYRAHKPDTWARWASSVPTGFKFSVKAPRAITHDKQLDCSRELLAGFVGQVGYLADKLGPILFQLPPSLAFDENVAHSFFYMLRELYQGGVVLEPRHASWFHPHVEEMLCRFQISRVAADPYCVTPAQRPGGILHEVAYFRLHGSPRKYYSPYSPAFINSLASEISQLARKAETWCIFDNTAAGAATGNAGELAKAVAECWCSGTPFKL